MELAKKIIALVKSESRLTFKPLPEDDPMQRKPDTTLAMEALSWKPSVSLDEGLTRTASYFKRTLHSLKRSSRAAIRDVVETRGAAQQSATTAGVSLAQIRHDGVHPASHKRRRSSES